MNNIILGPCDNTEKHATSVKNVNLVKFKQIRFDFFVWIKCMPCIHLPVRMSTQYFHSSRFAESFEILYFFVPRTWRQNSSTSNNNNNQREWKMDSKNQINVMLQFYIVSSTIHITAALSSSISIVWLHKIQSPLWTWLTSRQCFSRWVLLIKKNNTNEVVKNSVSISCIKSRIFGFAHLYSTTLRRGILFIRDFPLFFLLHILLWWFEERFDRDECS